MNPAFVGALKLLGFVDTVGQWIRHWLKSEIDLKGKGEIKGDIDITIIIDLGPQLTEVIREIFTPQNQRETPEVIWARATRELMRHNVRKLEALHQLGVSDYTLGMEALTQNADAVPDVIKSILRRYVERYDVSDRALSASPLLEAFEADQDGGSSPADPFGRRRVPPDWDK